MNNAFSVAWRVPCAGRCVSSNLLPNKAVRPFRAPPHTGLLPARWLSSLRNGRWPSPYNPRLTLGTSLWISRSCTKYGGHPPSFVTGIRSASTSSPDEVQFRLQKLSGAEIASIFGSNVVTVSVGNRLLRVLHARRLEGTLDLPLPADVTNAVSELTIEVGLEWLREKYPIDEDAAILERIEREEREEERKLIRRAEDLGLYKPQSGKYGAELGEEGDIYGKSVLQEVRKANEEKYKIEEERKRKEWLDGEAKDREILQKSLAKNTELAKFEESQLIEAKPRVDPSVRPALAMIQQYHVDATAKDWDLSKLNKPRRILPTLILTLVTLGLCYVFSESYELPPHYKRMWRDLPPAAATIAGLVGANLAIFILWRFPPAWKMLNRYFITVPMYPTALSSIGSVFSHQQLKHLAINMFILWFIGTRLHDEIGRGDFLALYTGAGVFASLVSLSAHVMANNLNVTFLGASGAISAIVATWCMLNKDENMTIAFIPKEWQETFSAKGSTFLTVIIALEVLNLVLPVFRVSNLDHWSHLGGYIAGIAGAKWIERKREAEREKKGLWERMFGR